MYVRLDSGTTLEHLPPVWSNETKWISIYIYAYIQPVPGSREDRATLEHRTGAFINEQETVCWEVPLEYGFEVLVLTTHDVNSHV